MQKWQFSTIIAGIGGSLAQLYGGWDVMLQVLLTLVALDYITGILAAIYRCRLSSAIGYKGIIKKVGIFIVVLVASLVAKGVGNDFVRSATILFYISNEAISILENVGRTGVRYPDKLKAILLQLGNDDGENKKSNKKPKHKDMCKCADKTNCTCPK